MIRRLITEQLLKAYRNDILQWLDERALHLPQSTVDSMAEKWGVDKAFIRDLESQVRASIIRLLTDRLRVL